MDPNSGTIYQFQSEEEKKKHEGMLRTDFAKLQLQGAPGSFLEMLKLRNLPKADCEYCAGAGAVQSKVTLKWIPCRCTNPEPMTPTP